MRRLLPVSFALLSALSLSTPAISPVFAQTKPRVQIPAESRPEARAIVNQLLREGRIIRSSQVKRGMRGVARSVFQGTKIEEFPIEVLGVLSRVQGGSDLVLIKVLGGPVVQRNSGIIAGMSGSPVYINGKMLGAIAIGWGFPKEPIGGVTPITEMIESSLPAPQRAKPAANTVPASVGPATGRANVPVTNARNAPAAPQGPTANPATASALRPDPGKPRVTYLPREPLSIAGRRIARVEVSRDFTAKPVPLRTTSRGAVVTMKPVSTLLQLSGWSQESLPRLRKMFAPYGIEPAIGPASRKTGVKAPFVPGGAIGVQLVSGDMDQTAVGTITFRWGQRILAFGHPMFGQGATSLPMTSSYIHEIFPSYQRSFKLSSPIETLGSLQQDTQYAIGGTLGMKADTIPMTIALRDPERQIARTYRVRVMKDPVLTPQLMQMVAVEAIETALGQTSDKMVRVGMRMQIDGASPIVRRNYLYAQDVVTEAALLDLAGSLNITQNNEFARGSIRRVDLDIALEPTRKTARIKSLFADRNRVKAGDTVRVSALLEPTGEPNKTVTQIFSFKVPENAPTGAMRVVASPASGYWAGQVRVGAAPPDPANLRELISAWNKIGAANTLLVQASTSNTYLLIDRKKVPAPSPSWQKLLRATPSTSIGSYNETQSQQVHTSYTLSGTQFLTLAVESRKDGDRPAESMPATEEKPAMVTTIDVTATSEPTPTAPEESDGPGTVPGDNTSNFGATAGSSRNRLWEMFDAKGFLSDIGALQASAQRLQNREPSDRPIAPSVTPPTPAPKPTTTPTVAPSTTPTPTPTPSVLPVDSGRGVGRPALRWVQGSTADFIRGTLEGAGVFTDGTIGVSAATKLLTTTPESFGWSVAGDAQGNVYLGTGNNARIIKVDAAGQSSTFYDGPGVGVTSLATDSTGNLYAGLTPGGGVVRFTPNGQQTHILNTTDAFVWALEWAENGDLLVGTGGTRGAIYRIPAVNLEPGTLTPNLTPLTTFEQKHVRAIAVRGDDIFLGTAAEGILYRVNATTGASTALYQADAAGTSAQNAQTEITAIESAPDGVYFGTFGSGTIYRWTEGRVTPVYPSPQNSVYALQRGADGNIYAATGDKGIVYQLIPAARASDIRASRVLEPKQLQTISLATAPSGDLLAGTGNNAAVFRIAAQGSVATGLYTSAVFDAKNVVAWGALRTIGEAQWETRSGNTAEPDDSWSAWQLVEVNDLNELRIVSPDSRYLQYRARLAMGKNVSRVEVIYRAPNSAPVVAFTAPKGGEYWRTKKTLTWSATDPNSDTLRYKLWLSDDGGTTWQTVALTAEDKATLELDTSKWKDGVYRAKVEASDALRNPDDPQSDDAVSAPFTIDNTPSRFESYTARKLANGDVTLEARAIDALSPLTGAEWRFVPFPKPTAKPVNAGTAAKPGTNATGSLTSSATQETTDKPGAAKTGGASTQTTVTVTTVTTTATTTSAATAAPVTPTVPALVATATAATAEEKPESDTNGWQALLPTDGIFDSRRETLTAQIPAAEIARTTVRKIELRVRDAAGNSTVVNHDIPA
jgi:hypothetical protein